MPLPGDQIVTYNGIRMRVRNMPGQGTRALWGYGHGLHRRPVWRPGLWFYTPDSCELADVASATRWVEGGRTLICLGCGLDCT
jgi:hypothetical protein